MERNQFKEAASYRIIDHLYEERKDFIILGICGKIGSGVTEAANILQKEFDELHLPQPGFEEDNLYAAHEYRILYTYAKQNNWKRFYNIRTSALLTRRVLSEPVEKFIEILKKFSRDEEIPVEDTCNDFFESQMTIDLKKYCRKLRLRDINSPWCFLEKDENIEQLKEKAKKPSDDPVQKIKYIISKKSKDLEEVSICFNMTSDIWNYQISNTDLSKLLDHYTECRSKKREFQNPFFYILLKQYLYEFLPAQSKKLWSKIREVSKRLPFTALQYIGNNLRMFKKPYYTSNIEFKKDGYICIAEDINLAIKVLRAYQLQIHDKDGTRLYSEEVKEENKRTLIVIDSIKNPYESMYLKTRYSSYYLIGIYTEDEERRKRLRMMEHLADDDIDAIDVIEQNSAFKQEIKTYARLENKKTYKGPYIIEKLYDQFKENKLVDKIALLAPFVIQNVSGCLETADILINNQKDTTSFLRLKKVLLRYICLIMNPGIVLPTNVERCMQIANTAKLNSGCISRQVGAVLTDAKYHLLSIGWNQQPEGQLPCLYQDLCEVHYHWSPNSYSNYENNDEDSFQIHIKEQVEEFFDTEISPLHEKGKLPCYCFKDYFNEIKGERNQVHTRALHAEETAFLNLGANNTQIKHGILFTTSSPCELCAKKAMYMGVSKIYYVEPYAGVSQQHVLSSGPLEERPDLILFTGAIGTAYTQLYTPLLPQKDEMEMWLGAKMDGALLTALRKKDTELNKESLKEKKVSIEPRAEKEMNVIVDSGKPKSVVRGKHLRRE